MWCKSRKQEERGKNFKKWLFSYRRMQEERHEQAPVVGRAARKRAHRRLGRLKLRRLARRAGG